MSAGAQTLSQEEPVAPKDSAAPHRPSVAGFKPRAEDALAHLLTRTPAMRLLFSAGLASGVIYALLVVAFPLMRWWNHPHLASNPDAINDMGTITGYSPLAAAAFVAAVLGLFWFQFQAIHAVSRYAEPSRALSRLALAFPVVFASIMVWMQPVTTTDLYGYVARGYLYAQLHLNPMTTPAFLLPGHLVVARPAAPYGPAWLLLTGLFSIISGENLLLNMLLFKLVGLAGLIACMWLLYVLARRLYPGSPVRFVMYFAWNPLVLFEAIGNGHNDIVMMACVLGALLLMVHRYARTAFALLVLGALIKYVAALLIPLWLVYELNQRRHRLAPDEVALASVALDGRKQARQPLLPPVDGQSARRQAAAHANGPRPARTSSRAPARGLAGVRTALAARVREAVLAVNEVERRAALELVAGASAIGLLLVAGFYLPFWDGLSTFAGVGQQLRPLYYNGSIVQFIVAPLELLVPSSAYTSLDKTVRLGFYAVFALYAGIQTYRLWSLGPRATLRDLITAAAKILFATLVLIAFWFQPWYVVWVLALAALADDSFVRSRAAILSGGSLLTYAVAYYLFAHETGLGQSLFVQFFEVLVTFLPLLLLRAAPEERSWQVILRSYVGLLGKGWRQRPLLWDRIMLALILVVAVILRLVRLGGNLFSSISPSSPTGAALAQVSGDLRLILADPRGLQGPFTVLQRALVALFGLRPFVILLPSAVIGSLTVLLIYLVTTAILFDGSPARARGVGLLAALLAATSRWHVSLSRSGVQLVALPFLMCLAVYLLVLALRLPVPDAAPAPAPAPARPKARRGKGRHHHRRAAQVAAPAVVHDHTLRRRILLFAGSGVAAGLAIDLAPGLWILPLIILGILIVARWQRPRWYFQSRKGLAALAAALVVTGLPGAWQYYLAGLIGFGSAGAAHQSVPQLPGPSLAAFLAQVAGNAQNVLYVLTAQDYSAGYPTTGGTPIIPVFVAWFLYAGVLLALWHWRRFSSMALLLLIALPLVASVAVGTQASVIAAASVLPALCIVPALALYELAGWLGRLPIALDRAHGVRIFANPENIGRLLLMAFLLFSALRTFYWYFQAMLPAAGPNTIIAS
jgi:hypothetical protein